MRISHICTMLVVLLLPHAMPFGSAYATFSIVSGTINAECSWAGDPIPPGVPPNSRAISHTHGPTTLEAPVCAFPSLTTTPEIANLHGNGVTFLHDNSLVFGTNPPAPVANRTFRFVSDVTTILNLTQPATWTRSSFLEDGNLTYDQITLSNGGGVSINLLTDTAGGPIPAGNYTFAASLTDHSWVADDPMLNLKSHVQVTFHKVPEPGSTGLWGGVFPMVGLLRRRH